MKKVDYYREYVYRNKSSKPSRLKEGKPFNPGKYQPSAPFLALVAYRTERCYTKSYRLLRENGFIDDSLVQDKLIVPEKLSFIEDYKGTLNFVKSLMSSLYALDDYIPVDFKGCTHLDIAPLLLIGTIMRDYITFRNKREKALSGMAHKVAWPNFLPSKNYEVNRILYMLQFIHNIEKNPDDIFLDVSTVGMIAERKTRTHFIENKKGPVCNRIRKYINKCVRKVGLQLTPEGETAIDGWLSEVLNNTEDHTLIDEWYVAGISLHTRPTVGDSSQEQDNVSEVRLAIMNLGFSIYDGFEQTQVENHQVYGIMERTYERVTNGLPEEEKKIYTRENLFTLYALQERMSRIKYLKGNESRGNGTMNFIKSFLELGDYRNDTLKARPIMSILSGKTMVLCDTRYKPYKDGTVYKLSLNSENDLSYLPDPDYLRGLPSPFPGTILETRLFFNKNHFLQKYDRAATNEV